MVWFVLIAVSAVTGLLRPPWWTALAWPAVAVGVGVGAVANEEPNYDMHGLGYFVGAVAAVTCVIAWLAGFGLATVVRRARHRPD
jgi:hypothetical protein